MAELVFDCIDVQSDRYAAGPTLNFRLRVAETSGERVHAIALRCQIRIEPQKRRYAPAEAARLNDLFGDASRWADTLKPLQFANVVGHGAQLHRQCRRSTSPVACTYDLDIASTSYFHALEEGEIPLLFLFSGTMFTKGTTGFSVTQVPWNKEASYRLPVSEWRLMMDRFFPNSGWLRVSRSTLEALGAFKSARALPTWEQTLTVLLDEVARPADAAS